MSRIYWRYPNHDEEREGIWCELHYMTVNVDDWEEHLRDEHR